MTRAGATTFDPAPVLARFQGNTDADIAHAVGVTKSTVQNWRHNRRWLKVNQADRIACDVLGVHPVVLWPEWGREDWLAKHRGEG